MNFFGKNSMIKLMELIKSAFDTKVNKAGDTVTGSLVLSKTTDASGTEDKGPALIVGGTRTTAHIEMDANEIMAKNNGTTPSTLTLNNDGGTVNIGKMYGDDKVTVNGTDIRENSNKTAVTFYVSPSGSDETGDGTVDKPFATIQHAVNHFPRTTATNKILLAGGTYNFTGVICTVDGKTVQIDLQNDVIINWSGNISGFLASHGGYIYVNGGTTYSMTLKNSNGGASSYTFNVQNSSMMYLNCKKLIVSGTINAPSICNILNNSTIRLTCDTLSVTIPSTNTQTTIYVCNIAHNSFCELKITTVTYKCNSTTVTQSRFIQCVGGSMGRVRSTTIPNTFKYSAVSSDSSSISFDDVTDNSVSKTTLSNNGKITIGDPVGKTYIGTVTEKTIKPSTYDTVATLSLPANGVYVVTARSDWSTSFSATTVLQLLTGDDQVTGRTPGDGGGGISLTNICITGSSAASCSLKVYQASTANRVTQHTKLYAVKIA